jgi:ADP-ribosyl cyclase 1
MFVLFTLWNLMGVVSAAGRASPRNLAEIVIGRCEEYQRVVHPELFQQNELKNCTDLWLKLRKAFADKGPCDVTVESYQDFVDAAAHKIDTQDKVMYWSGSVYPMVVNFAHIKSNQYVTIREILAAYVIRNMEDFCGQVAPPGINYESDCPAWGSCPLLAVTSFWTALSKNFAKEVKGTVHLMLDGSAREPYRRTSIFAHSELKNLDAARTPSLHVHLAYNLNGPIKEKCGEGTIALLREDVEKKGMKFKCSDDDQDILYFQCVTNMAGDRCKAFATGTSTAGGTGAVMQHPLVLFPILFITSALLIV